MVRRLYGRGPGHLVGLLVSFAVAVVALMGWFDSPHSVVSVIEWFVAAIVVHDLVLVPAYAALDRIAFGRRSHRRRWGSGAVRAVNATPYLRVPTMLSLLLGAVFFPVILGLGARAELNASGITEHGYLARWLVACAVMYALSGLAYVVARLRRRGADRDPKARAA
jgi:fumarate reductase subunit D